MSDLYGIPRPDLEGIAARAAAATEGPWYVSGTGFVCTDRPGSARHVVWDEEEPADPHNARFIAAARTDLPAVVSYALQLEAEVERLREARAVALSVIDMKVGVYRRAAAEKAGTHTAITCRAAADALDEVRAALNTTEVGSHA